MLLVAVLLAVSVPSPPVPSPGSPVVSEEAARVKEEILKVLRGLSPQVQACGKKASGPTEATLFFTVDTTGVARDVGVDLLGRAADCIKKIVAGAHFPAVVTPQEVTVPLKLTRRKPATDCSSVDLDMPQPPEVFDAAAIPTRVNTILPAVRQCARTKGPRLVRATWTIDTHGTPVNIAVDEAAAPAVRSCIAAQIATLRFAKPAQDEPVSFPFKLR